MTSESRARFDASDIIQKHLDNVKNYIIFQMDAYGRNASGKHVNSLTTEVSAATGILWGLYSYNFMETGRAGGKVPMNFRSIIKQWIIDKGIPFTPIPYKTKGQHKYSPAERGLNTLAYFISRKIMREGTALFRSGVREDIYSSAINRECQAIMQESSLRIGDIIQNINKNA